MSARLSGGDRGPRGAPDVYGVCPGLAAARPPGIVWYIRYLTPEGFYGEVRYQPTDTSRGRATGVSAQLTAADAGRVAAILAELSAAGPTELGPCFALLGRYTQPGTAWDPGRGGVQVRAGRGGAVPAGGPLLGVARDH
jgi:hypothetical protein